MLSFYCRTDGGDVLDEAPHSSFEWTTDPGDREFLLISCDGKVTSLTSPGRVFHAQTTGL